MAKILVVDDDLYMLELYKAFLGEAGHEVRTAQDASFAISTYQDFLPDLIVLDVDLPAGGGLRVYERVRNLFMAATPVIFMTGLPEQVSDVHKDPNARVMSKPINQPLLLENMSRLLARAGG